MSKIWFQADYYFNNKKKLTEMFGDAACPVSMNGGYVCEKTDKWGMNKECGDETQANIQERFGLQTPSSEEEY